MTANLTGGSVPGGKVPYARLAQIATSALQGEELRGVLSDTCELVRDALGTEIVGVLKLLPEAGLLHLIAGVGWQEGLVGQAAVPARNRAQGAHALASTTPVVVTDLADESRFRPALVLADHGATSGVSVVVRGRGTPFGVLWAFSTAARTFAGEDVELVSNVAETLAGAVRATTREAELLRRGLRDVLTGLPNWVLFLDRLDQGLSRARRHSSVVGVIYLDVDGFGGINERLGTQTADRLLLELAHRLRNAVRADDTVARYESDSFAVLCEDVGGTPEVLAIAQRIQRAMAAPLVPDDPFTPTASIGVAVSPGPATPPEVLLDHARTAMTAARAIGGNRIEVYEEQRRPFPVPPSRERALGKGE